ncbi:thiol-activated cytolysin family protein [Paenibacillus apiarius]|uniref:Thiol-activated cytolysin n=1 Tax=Paenibacillus apiarius TaxID=46240 RepID=A0ABT4E1K7_9BACL|nr:thiol-activated cytolysin family protein [Paenibacillus apiarius]MCY9516430.1 thiol-activated cytolysin family protein [Paenibacillus apiarius]MCY9523484.1 thiol-activated cytolysin family protein [Paenibacillus apiarius]MCY9554296.1 thiol-activated cytolysin family protein [Paenibacillus apiarius]MCY9561609.1 thiol-activated cytolysin family protein [Paenibacillus apiarius]MCY9687029.1 thiol-activated cytolysin family protein [Paenibacillus apiarius]
MKIPQHGKGIKVLVSLLIGLHVFTYSSISFAATNEPNDIDSGIAGLNYNRNEVLAVKGDQISSFVPKEGIQSNDKFIVVERDKKSLTTSPVDISIIDSITNRTYPGALQLANQDFADNQPSLVMAARKPLDITIDLPGLKNENTITVQNPTYSSVSSAVDQLVSTWGEKYSDTHTLPARLQYAESMVYSQNQIASALNVNSKVLNGTLGIDFNAVASGEKKVMVAAYKQIFYTVSAALPNNPSDLFDDSVTFAELVRKGVSNEAPPLMVSNVAYGRTIYVKLETTSKSSDVQTAFKLLLNNPSIQASGQYKDIYENSSFTAVVLGGDAQTHNQVVSKDFDVIQNVIKDNAQYSSKNPAYPISYTSVFLKDNSIAAVHNNTDYIETKTTEYTKGKITLDHSGAYVAQFEVSWDEFTFDENGQEIITHKTWEGNWQDKTAHFSTEIPLPPNAKNIKIFARECTGLAWEWWRTIINEPNVPLTSNIKVSIWGTTLNPSADISH